MECLGFLVGSFAQEVRRLLTRPCPLAVGKEVCGFPGSVTEHSPCYSLPGLPLPPQGINDRVQPVRTGRERLHRSHSAPAVATGSSHA